MKDFPTERYALPDFGGWDTHHFKADSVFDHFINSPLFSILKYLDERGNDGFSTSINTHNNLFRSRMFRFLDETMKNVKPETVLKCRLNNTQVTDEVVLKYLCPNDSGKGHNGPDLRDVMKKLTKKKDPQFVMRGILHFWMDTDSLKSPEVTRLMTRAGLRLQNAEMNLLKNLNRETLHDLLIPCGSHTTHISCEDDSRDFCVGNTIYVGLFVLLAIFLPGLVRALGNLIFYKVIKNHENQQKSDMVMVNWGPSGLIVLGRVA